MEKKRGLSDACSDEFLSTIESGSRDAIISNNGDSSASGMKRMKLSSTLPTIVVPLNNIPLDEKNEWLLKLKMELEIVRTLQKRLDFYSAHAVKNKGNFSLPLMKQCKNLLKNLMAPRHGLMFNKPVDIIKFEIPDYFDIIKNPMDLGTIKGKLGSLKYSTPLEFRDDVRLTFTNAMTYNPPGNPFHAKADKLSKLFEQRWKTIEKKLPVNEFQQEKVIEIDLAKEEVKLMMTDEEKQKLNVDLEVHLDKLPGNIINFLRKHASNGNDVEDEIEVDVDDLDNDSLFKLRKMLDDHMEHEINCKVEASVIDESGISNLTLQSSQESDSSDEDIDICGTESP